ncbi:MAG: hypothetical protein CME88_08990 [Hirschia sp.]|nr:hypothetical protein [Hirschia sp.]MBF18498.1 hypothetical protein [Hirschia sp.]|tara:strand:- start:103 stop:432 length:330 start_codon:yes stop_codon:yes gene_type:complete
MTDTAPFFDINRFLAALRRFGDWASKAGFGLVLILVAGIALLVTTFVGVLIASAAVLLRLAHSFSNRKSSRADTAGTASGTRPMNVSKEGALDAHRTPDGWVVEPSTGN